jgi:hypothetical protein
MKFIKYDVNKKIFLWKAVDIDKMEPRAFHPAVLFDRYIFIFGGLNLETIRRYGISPLRINVFSWEISEVLVGGAGLGGLPGHLSGSAILPCADKAFLIGGYTQHISKEDDKPCDSIIEVSFSSQGNHTIKMFE